MHLVHRSDLQVSRNRHHDFDEQIFTSAVDHLVYIYVVHQATVYIQLTYVSSNFKSIFMLLYCPYSRHLGIWLCRKHTVNLHRLREYTYIIDNMYSHDTYPAILLSFEHVQCFKYLNHGQYHNPVYTMDIVS